MSTLSAFEIVMMSKISFKIDFVHIVRIWNCDDVKNFFQNWFCPHCPHLKLWCSIIFFSKLILSTLSAFEIVMLYKISFKIDFVHIVRILKLLWCKKFFWNCQDVKDSIKVNFVHIVRILKLLEPSTFEIVMMSKISFKIDFVHIVRIWNCDAH